MQEKVDADMRHFWGCPGDLHFKTFEVHESRLAPGSERAQAYLVMK